MKNRFAILIMMVALVFLSIMIVPMTGAVTEKTQILNLGDMYGSGLHQYVETLLEKPYTIEEIKYGNPSLTSEELLNILRHERKLANDIKESDLIIISVGTNDLLHTLMYINDIDTANEQLVKQISDKNLKRFNNNLKAIFSLMSKYDKTVLIGDMFNPLLVGEKGFQHADELTRLFNQEIYEIASKNGVKVAPVNEEFLSAGNKAQLLCSNEFTLTEKGDKIYAQAFRRITDSKIEALFKSGQKN